MSDDENSPDFDDMVLSDIHVFNAAIVLEEKGNLSVSRFFFRRPQNECRANVNLQRVKQRTKSLKYDDDGDLVIERDDKEEKFELLTLVHKMATPLKNVGQQVWRGAFLLSDFIIHEPERFHQKCCLELGAGIGMCGIVAGMVARSIYVTDFGELTLDICQQNVKQNSHLLLNGTNVVKVRELNWLENEFKSNRLNSNYGWSCEDLENLKETDVIFAADVIYEDQLTDALFGTILKLIENCKGSRISIYLAVERRLNFTVEDLDVACPAYDYFVDCLSNLENGTMKSLGKQGRHVFKLHQLNCSFPQYFNYDRVKEMELWEISCSKSLL